MPLTATTDRHAAAVLPVLVHIEEHLDDPLTLDDLARIAGFSPHHFHRVFRQVTGEAPKQYVRRLRLEHAVARLKVSPDNVLQIALEAGFATHETFTRAFAARFDLTPSEFRGVLRDFRAAVADEFEPHTFDGFTDDTPLTLRFDMRREPVTVERMPARHLLFARHVGFEHLLDGGRDVLDLWSEVLAYADAHGIDYAPDTLVALTHDDPYVTDDARIRFDACFVLDRPVAPPHPFGFRTQPASLCVVRRHTGGLEEVAKTFAQLGVAWLAPDDHRLSAASPFEVIHCRRVDGRLERMAMDACVPLEPSPERNRP